MCWAQLSVHARGTRLITITPDVYRLTSLQRPSRTRDMSLRSLKPLEAAWQE